MAAGTLQYQRFQADLADPINMIFDGNTEVLFSADSGAWIIPLTTYFDDWWEAPSGEMADVWQSWNIGDPYVLSNGWTGSEDSGRFYYVVVPEPITMLGVFLGIGGLTNYMRKRKLNLA
jgi:hypothetical protein